MVLLTGASGFIGNRFLAALQERQVPTAILLRPAASQRLLAGPQPYGEVRVGTLGDAASLDRALEGITQVLHCAGKTKALRTEEFHEVNTLGTRNLIEAIRRRGKQVSRFVHLSSLAACGPAIASAPAREDDPPAPVSDYGRSKLAAEQVIARLCPVPYVILRPGGVYGPGDSDFLQLFRMVGAHLIPTFAGGRQPLSLVYVDDLATLAMRCLTTAVGAGRVYHVAHPTVVTAGELAQEIARQMGSWTVPLPLPKAALGLVAAVQDLISRWTKKPGILCRERCCEVRAPGWVCDTSRLRHELGWQCATALPEGIRQTLAWYRAKGWL